MSLTYLALEIRRALRSGRFLIFTVAFPAVMFMFFAGLFGDAPADGTPYAQKVLSMVSMTCWGAFSAAMFAGSRVAVERTLGWQRQLRLTPVTGAGYLGTKVLVGMAVALPAVILVPLVGAAVEGVRLDPAQWLRVTLVVWLGALPFAVLGLLLGQLGTADSMQAITSVAMLILAMLGGLWFPLQIMPHWLGVLAKVTPTYWLNQLGLGALLPGESALTCVAVLAAWAAGTGVLVTIRYRRDSARA